MIEVYNAYDPLSVADVVVFATGEIESPHISKIVKIDLKEETDIEAKRSELYALERKGIRQAAGDVFIYYIKADFIGERRNQGDSYTSVEYNNRLDAERSRREIAANPITQFHVDEDRGTISITYAAKSPRDPFSRVPLCFIFHSSSY